LVDAIHRVAVFRSVKIMSNDEIDEFGISRCWREAARGLAQAAHEKFPDAEIILDGNRLIGLRYVRPEPKADDKYTAVSAASILAKYAQCCTMDDIHKVCPEYGFDRNRGYLTKVHQEALQVYGPCAYHRTSFRPIRKLLRNRAW
jgi:ribonuclease HII